MNITLRDMYGALPTIKYNINTLNPWGIVVLAAMFCSTCIVLSACILLYKWALGLG